jgi:hypothetical protein
LIQALGTVTLTVTRLPPNHSPFWHRIQLRATLPYGSNHLIVGCGECYYIFDSYPVSTHIRIMIIFNGRLRHILAWSGWSLVFGSCSTTLSYYSQSAAWLVIVSLILVHQSAAQPLQCPLLVKTMTGYYMTNMNYQQPPQQGEFALAAVKEYFRSATFPGHTLVFMNVDL